MLACIVGCFMWVLMGCGWFDGLLARLVVVVLACYWLLGGWFAGCVWSGCGFGIAVCGWFGLIRCVFAGLICWFAGLLWRLVLCCFLVYFLGFGRLFYAGGWCLLWWL